MSLGIKHLIECHCTLQIYKGGDNHLYHKFPVYTKFDKDGKAIEKIAQCNNCKTLHKVYDICRSDIVRSGKDENRGMINIDDIAIQLPDKISRVLYKYNCDISTWEQVLDIFDQKIWNQYIVLTRELVELFYHVKILHIINDNDIKILSEKITDEISLME